MSQSRQEIGQNTDRTSSQIDFFHSWLCVLCEPLKSLLLSIPNFKGILSIRPFVSSGFLVSSLGFVNILDGETVKCFVKFVQEVKGCKHKKKCKQFLLVSTSFNMCKERFKIDILHWKNCIYDNWSLFE